MSVPATEKPEVERVAYEETEHYRITRAFMANPDRVLKTLLERDDE